MSDTWTPISLETLQKQIDADVAKMSPRERALWNFIRITPQKWNLSPWGDQGGGFWVVAVFGDACLYYNDIESGFNSSGFAHHGTIADYICNQDELPWILHGMMDLIDAG